MDRVDFKPSDVVITTPTPLVGTMGQAEAEFAAALIVCVLRDSGDVWGPVAWKHVGAIVRRDVAENREPLWSLCTNPFLRPDAFRLAADGFATISDDHETVEFTTKGVEALRRWVRR